MGDMKSTFKYKHAKEAAAIKIGGIEAQCTSHPEAQSGSGFFKFADTTLRLEDDDGTEIMAVCGIIGGGLELRDSRSGMSFRIHPRVLLKFFDAALKDHPDWHRLVKERKVKPEHYIIKV
jgi:hypothetical protein